MSVAIFDLDCTLLSGDSDHTWGEFLVERGLVDAESHRRENDRFYAEYRAGRLDIAAFLAFALQPLTRFERAELERLHAEFMEQKIAPMITPAARALVEKHRAQGDVAVIATSTNRFITAPIARAFGVEHLLATELEERNGRYTGRVLGLPCFREGKLEHLRLWLARERLTLAGSWCYSDSANDLPLLSQVEHPVAVNPDRELAAHAARAGWPVIKLH